MRTSEHFSTIVTGVITNSDDRVPDILSSFGLRVSPLRYGMLDTAAAGEMGHDIDFHCMSYDVGYEKPDKRVFTAAEEMLNIILDSRESQRGPDGCWLKIYVGDEYGKDVEGSTNAGWKAIFLDPTGSSPQIPRVEDHYDVLLSDAFQQQPVMRVQSIQNMIHWLVTPK
jgi:ribonucleotide monophosphatase NagD (HAD superfamily)